MSASHQAAGVVIVGCGFGGPLKAPAPEPPSLLAEFGGRDLRPGLAVAHKKLVPDNPDIKP